MRWPGKSFERVLFMLVTPLLAAPMPTALDDTGVAVSAACASIGCTTQAGWVCVHPNWVVEDACDPRSPGCDIS